MDNFNSKYPLSVDEARRMQFLLQQAEQDNLNFAERKEFLELLRKDDALTDFTYEEALKNNARNEFFDKAVTIGGLAIIGYLLTKLFTEA